ncbi:extracellular solute-binding protein [Clostridium sp. D2Q-11]|uniref:Extracellular solute-binding protein n=1 Tax=Anaeromonas frigoriresistens TaxID=2683708 RepID=A0A942V082_9FIRM|nr:extracellular solute-binding protein [Anaeromonas frigoriresistens]MBS4539506.1 extracellular solute-binding protein [Anaeromonas frigoriresistens]
MKNNRINIALILVILIIFITYFTFMKLTYDKDIMAKLELAENYARQENWDQVTKESKELKEIWNSSKALIMFNFAEAEYSLFENHIDYIIGGAEAKQLDTTLVHILAAQDLWENSKQVVPEP